MGALDNLMGKHVIVNDVPLPDRKTVRFAGAVTASDSPSENTTDIVIASGSGTQNLSSVLGIGNSAAGEQLKNVGAATDPNDAVTKLQSDGIADARIDLREYATMALSRAIAPVSGRRTITKGFAAAGDGGGGQWLDVTGAAPGTHVHNGGTVIVPIAGDGSAAKLWQSWTEVDARWFGAAPTASGATNHAAFAAALALGKPLVISSDTYTITGATLVATAAIRGTGPATDAGSKLVCGASLAGPMLRYSVSGGRMSGFTVDGANLADICIEILNSNISSHDSITVIRARYDGVHYPIAGNNLGTVWTALKAMFCGRHYTTGTVTAAAGATVITVTGAADLTTIGIRESFDSIYFDAERTADVAGGELCGLVHDVSVLNATQLTIYPPLTTALTAATFSVNMGSGVNIGAHSINGSMRFISPLFFENADAGLRDAGLFGATVIGGIYEHNHAVGRVLGRQLGTAANSTGGTDVGPHFEASFGGSFQYAFCYRVQLLPGMSTTLFAGNEHPAFRVWPFSHGPPSHSECNDFRSISGDTAVLAQRFSGRIGLIVATARLVLQSGGLGNFQDGETYYFKCRANVQIIAGAGATVSGRLLYGNGSTIECTHMGGGEWFVSGGGGYWTSTTAAQPSAPLFTNETILLTDGNPDSGSPSLVTSAAGVWRRSDGNIAQAGLYVPYLTYPNGRSVAGKAAAGAGLGDEIGLTDNTVLAALGSAAISAQKVTDPLCAFASADGKVLVERVSPGAATDSASLANAATLLLSYTTATNRDHALIAVVKMTVASVRYVVRLAVDAENVAGTVAVLGQQVLGALPVGVTLVANVSGTSVRAALLNSTGAAIGPIRMRWSRATVEDPS